MDHLPVIDLSAAPEAVARGIAEACRAHGFFYVVGHGIDESLGERLEDLSRRFFALPEATKASYAMPLRRRSAPHAARTVSSTSPVMASTRRWCSGSKT